MIIDKIRDFMLTCPLLENGSININCLGSKPVCYSIEQVAKEPVVKRYCDGGALKQCCFIFAVRDSYDEVPEFNIEAAELMEQIEGWVEQQNMVGNLPQLENSHLFPESIEVTSSGSMFDSTIDSARLQIEFRLLYRQER